MTFRSPKSPSDMSTNWRASQQAESGPRATAGSVEQQLYNQQAMLQMQYTLEALKLQNLEIQERLMAAIGSDGPFQESGSYQPAGSTGCDHASGGAATQRRGALEQLARVQQNRSGFDRSPSPRPNRLSFGGLAESAMARRVAQSPPDEPSSIEPSFLSHQRTDSSTSSASIALFEQSKHMTSPSGPTLVLSQPGDAFPSPTLGRTNRLDLAAHMKAEESDSTASSPRSSHSSDGASELSSFESAPSFGTPQIKPKAPRLNPSAPAFVMATPPPIGRYEPGRYSSPPSAPGLLIVKPVRQPKGPCAEHEMDTLNFAGRIRARAFLAMRNKLRSPQSPLSDRFS